MEDRWNPPRRKGEYVLAAMHGASQSHGVEVPRADEPPPENTATDPDTPEGRSFIESQSPEEPMQRPSAAWVTLITMRGSGFRDSHA
jgi:hypothetical protein